GRVRRRERQAQLLDETEICGMGVPDQLTAELHGTSVVAGDLLDTPADAVAGLEHENVGAPLCEVTRRGQPREACAEHEDVGHAVTASSSARMRSASAG